MIRTLLHKEAHRMDGAGVPQKDRACFPAQPPCLIRVKEWQLLRLELVVISRGSHFGARQRAGRLEEGRMPFVALVLHQQRASRVWPYIHHVDKSLHRHHGPARQESALVHLYSNLHAHTLLIPSPSWQCNKLFNVEGYSHTISCKHHLDAEESTAQWGLISMQPGCLVVDNPSKSARGQAIDGVEGAQQLIGAPQHRKYLQKHWCSLLRSLSTPRAAPFRSR